MSIKSIETHNFRKNHVKEILHLLYPELEKDLSECSVLDVGCGRGILSCSIAKHVSYLKGIDVNKYAIDCATKLKHHKGIKNADFEIKSIMDFKERKKYDIIFMIDAIEHIKEQQKALDIAMSCLNEGGVFYITTNNKIWPMEGHFFLPFLSYLPKSLANKYVEVFRNGADYNGIFLLSYWKIKKLLDNTHATYTFKPPKDPRNAMHWFGKSLVNIHKSFWIFVNVFQIIGKKGEI